MGEKHEQTIAMLNDDNHPTRTRLDDSRAPTPKVKRKEKKRNGKFLDICNSPSVVRIFVGHFEIIFYSH